jgi:ATP synthase protein I
MAQPLPPEPPRPPEAPDRTPHIRLLQEPPERKVTGPRPRPGLRKRPAPDQDVPMPARGLGMTIVSYLIAGIVAYGGIGWLIGRAVHVPALAPVGMALGLVISMSLIIYRYGRSTPPRIRRFAPKPDEQNGPMTTQLQNDDARGTDR